MKWIDREHGLVLIPVHGGPLDGSEQPGCTDLLKPNMRMMFPPTEKNGHCTVHQLEQTDSGFRWVYIETVR